jgi:L-ascorbate metabolism protein UlaG (beta-lactamase superfamily)
MRILNQIISGILLICSTYSLSGCSQMGENPSGPYLEELKKSPNYSIENSKFENRRENIFEEMREEDSFWTNPMKRFSNNMLFNSNQTVPEQHLPEVRPPDIKEFLEPTESIKFIWFGHSTILINIRNTIVLVDPVFSPSASPISFIVPRFQPPVLDLEELPRIDVVLISHDHYDHLDMKTVQYLKDDVSKFIVPLGVSSHLRSWGINDDQITELDWWKSTDFKGVSFTSTPAQHFSGRQALFNISQTLWSSWVVQSRDVSFYFSGDSGYDVHYKQIGEKYGPLDLVFIDSGQYNLRWRGVHNLPEEAVQASIDLKGRYLVPVHWGMFNLAIHNWYDPIQESVKFSKKHNVNLMTPKLGQLISLEKSIKTISWWSGLIGE